MFTADTLVSVVRTTCALILGSITSWLASRLGLVIDEDTQSQLVIGFTFLVTSLIYAAIRSLEAKWPGVGILLGIKRAPVYAGPKDIVAVTDSTTGLTVAKQGNTVLDVPPPNMGTLKAETPPIEYGG